jgi:2,3-bisphosphoglycerate-independent phosphoglycerate mutase
VATYDLKPEMSAIEVTDEVIRRIENGQYDCIILNYANMDMVGHTGILDAAIRACETVDGCVGRVVEAIGGVGGTLLITADHGNAEMMSSGTGDPHTAHTVNPVRLILAGPNLEKCRLRDGILGDIAPTILEILGISQPEKMTGRSLLMETDPGSGA